MTAERDQMRSFWERAAAHQSIAPQRPQRADCLPSCCKTPYACGRQFQCACHQGER